MRELTVVYKRIDCLIYVPYSLDITRRFRRAGLGVGGWALGCGPWGLGFRVQGCRGAGVQGLRWRVQGLGFGVWGLEFWVWVWVWGGVCDRGGARPSLCTVGAMFGVGAILVSEPFVCSVVGATVFLSALKSFRFVPEVLSTSVPPHFLHRSSPGFRSTCNVTSRLKL